MTACCPWKVPLALVLSFYLMPYHVFPALPCTCILLPRWAQLCWHNSLLTKNFNSRIYTSDQRVFRRSSLHFFLKISPWIVRRCISAVCSLACTHDQTSYVLLLSLHLFTCINFLWFVVYLFLTGCIRFFGILSKCSMAPAHPLCMHQTVFHQKQPLRFYRMATTSPVYPK